MIRITFVMRAVYKENFPRPGQLVFLHRIADSTKLFFKMKVILLVLVFVAVAASQRGKLVLYLVAASSYVQYWKKCSFFFT